MKESKPFGNERFAGEFYHSIQWKKFRAWYELRYPKICALCGKPGYYLDHIVPISQGGARLDESNVQWLCPRCHVGKTNKERKQK